MPVPQSCSLYLFKTARELGSEGTLLTTEDQLKLFRVMQNRFYYLHTKNFLLFPAAMFTYKSPFPEKQLNNQTSCEGCVCVCVCWFGFFFRISNIYKKNPTWFLIFNPVNAKKSFVNSFSSLLIFSLKEPVRNNCRLNSVNSCCVLLS